jgi:hypothetical protein
MFKSKKKNRKETKKMAEDLRNTKKGYVRLEKDPTGRTIITPEGRLSFPSLHVKKEYQGKYSYQATLLFSKTGIDFTAISSAIQAATNEGWKDKKPPTSLKRAFKDGDKTIQEYGDQMGFDHEKRPEYKGHYVLRTSATDSPSRPAVRPICKNVDGSVIPVELIPQILYGGCYARFVIQFYAYGNKPGATFSPGISASLLGVQKIREGEAFASSIDVDDEFGALETEEATQDSEVNLAALGI